MKGKKDLQNSSVDIIIALSMALIGNKYVRRRPRRMCTGAQLGLNYSRRVHKPVVDLEFDLVCTDTD